MQDDIEYLTYLLAAPSLCKPDEKQAITFDHSAGDSAGEHFGDKPSRRMDGFVRRDAIFASDYLGARARSDATFG